MIMTMGASGVGVEADVCAHLKARFALKTPLLLAALLGLAIFNGLIKDANPLH